MLLTVQMTSLLTQGCFDEEMINLLACNGNF